MGDIREDFKRSSRFGIVGVVVVGVAAAAIALLFGSGASPTGAMAAILALVFGFVAMLLYLQRGDLDRAQARDARAAIAPDAPVDDPTTVDHATLMNALAIKPIDRAALAGASATTWGLARSSQRSAWVLLVLIACAVVPWQLWQELWSIVVFVPAIIVYTVYLCVRLLMPHGDLDHAYEASAAALAPLGLERDGALAYTGHRHGRSVSVRLGGDTVTRVSGSYAPFEVRARGERLRALDGAPPPVGDALAGLRASSYWKGVRVVGGPEGVTVEREGGADRWLCDLWLAERLAAVAPAAD